MSDLEKLARELERSGRAGALRELAASPEARRLAERVDAKAAEEALRSGDAGALAALLRGVLGTDEGRRLAREVEERRR